MTVLLAHGAPRHKEFTGAVPVGGTTEEIAAARQAWQQAIAKYGEDHPITAFMLSNLALAMREGGYFNYAEHYAKQSLAVLERRFGPTDVSLVPSLNVLAEAAVSQGRFDEARGFAVRAIAIGPDAGAHYGTALHNLAALYQAEGQFQEAARYYRQALAFREKVLPPGHLYIRMTRAALKDVERLGKLTADNR